MRRKHINRTIILIFVFLGLFSCSSALNQSEKVRKPAVAGMFYPDDKQELEAMIGTFMSKAPPVTVEGSIHAIIVPHAGYVYSGQVAAFAYSLIKKYRSDCKLVILIGPSHRYPVENVAVYNKPGLWETPIGKVKVDYKVSDDIISYDNRFSFIEDAFAKEHSLEVQLPFLQKVLEEFKIVPIIINNPSNELCYKLASSIVNATKGKNPLIVCSTDMSHYHSYKDAVKMDNEVIDCIKNLDSSVLINTLSEGDGELCGSAAVLTTLYLSKALNIKKATLLKYANSGDVTGDKSKVVGYSSFYLEKLAANSNDNNKEAGGMLDKKQQDILLKIARATIKSYLNENKLPEFNISDPVLREKRGVFVTLHKYGSLRGCIGYTMPVEELYKSVMKMAIQSSTQDPRFRPVTSSELDEIDIEISVLSVPEKVSDVNEIILGKHGVIVKKGFNQGVFLPQVATETGWSREEFLSRLCADKADLSENAWKDKNTELLSFSAQIFREKGEK